MGRKFYITTPIYYINSYPHLGTAYATTCTDILARYGKLLGWDVYFVTGTDEHSINVEKKAREQGLEPLEYCNKMADTYKKVWKKLEVNYNYFIQTTFPEHERAVLEIFKRLYEKKLIYKAFYKGLYCSSCESYVKESDLIDRKCPYHKLEPIKLEEENYFFRLSIFKDKLRRVFLEKDFMWPVRRKNEMLSILEGELEDISISRTSFTFGIKVPDDPKHIIYVWFDALINYLTACGFPDDNNKFKYYWPADVHIIGKDIARFHTIVWPAMLLGADIEIPIRVFAHGFIQVSGEKMSKTLGNVVDPVDIAERFGIDLLRFYFAKEFPFGEDGGFSEENLIKRYNGELANEWGNLIQRMVTLSRNYNNFTVQKPNFDKWQDLRNDIEGLYKNLENNILRCDIYTLINKGWDIVKRCNRMVDEVAPWKLYKVDKQKAIEFVNTLLVVCIYLNKYFSPVLVESSVKLDSTLGKNLGEFDKIDDFKIFLERLPQSFTIEPPPILFPKLTDKPK